MTVRLNPRPARTVSSDVSYVNMDQTAKYTSPPRRWRTVNLIRYPSAAVISAHKHVKNKNKSDNNSSNNGTGATTSNNDHPDSTKCDNTVPNTNNLDNNQTIVEENATNCNRCELYEQQCCF